MRSIVRLAGLALVASTVSLVAPAHATIPAQWANCTAVHHRYPHGVGRQNAHDHTSGTPVRNFYHSDRIYRIAINANGRLDADKDGIACEKA